MNILSRAKSIHNENYLIGQWLEIGNRNFIICDTYYTEIEDSMGWFDDGDIDGYIKLSDNVFEVDKDTRSIHFENMIDINDNKVFASLNESGIGGDLLEHNSDYFGKVTTTLYFENLRLIKRNETEHTFIDCASLSKHTIAGIKL